MATKLDLYNQITGGTDNDMFKSITGKDRSTVNKEYNLSPVKTSGYLKQKKPKTTKSKSILSGYLKTGALSDGYDFGDLTKTVFGTLSSIEQNAARGVSKATEGILDTGLWGVGKVAEKLGQQKIADATKKIIAKDITGEGKQVENIMGLSSINQAINDILNGRVPYKRNVENIFAPTKQAMRTNVQDFTVEEAIDDFLKNYQTEEDKKTKANTILGEKAEGLVQSGAQMLGTQALQATTGIPWWVTTGLSSFGSQTEEAFNEGASYNQAGMSALVSALGEVLTEKISGGISYGGKTLDKGLKSQLTKGISNKVLNTLAQYGIDVLGEGGEEVLSNIITRLGKKLTYEKDKTWKELLTSEEAVDSYIQDFIGGAVMGGIGNVSQAVSSIKTGRNYETGLTEAEQKVVDTEVENRIGDKKVSAKERTKIEDQVKRDLEKVNEKTESQTSETKMSLSENAKRYEDLVKTNNIEYFRKDNGDIRVNLMDSNSNLVNQFDLYNKREAITQLGEQLGSEIYEKATPDNQIYRVGNDINNLGNDNDYFMTHRPTETGITADDLTKQGYEVGLPSDIYEHPEYYSMNETTAKETMNQLNKVRNNPDADVTIYRATSGDKINNGDWVTLSKSYAKQHNESQFDGKGNIVEKVVKAKDIQHAGDSLEEWGYFPMKTTLEEETTLQSETQSIAPVRQREENPLTISRLTPEDANTTPKLPQATRTKGEGRSRVLSNITETSQILNEEQKAIVRSAEDIKYYDSVTNEQALDKAFKRLNDGGRNETLNWMSKDSKNADSTDVAEGWILMKQYADNNDIDGLIATAKKMKEIGTTAGQTVQAFNIMERLTPEGMVAYAQSELLDAYNEMVKNKSQKWIDKYRNNFELTGDEVMFIMDTMKEVSQMEDGYDKQVKLAEIQKIMTDKLPPEKGQKIKSWMRLSMLFNPKTQVRNVVGNAIIAPVNYFGDMFASAADYLVARKTNVRTTGNINVKAMLKGLKDGAYQATNDYRKGINTRDMEGNRFEIAQSKSFSQDNLIGKSLNNVESLLNYVMDAGDRVFSQSAFENSLQNQMKLNNVTKPTQEMIDIARKEALSRTWNDNNNYTNLVLNIRKNLNRVGTKHFGLGDVLIPFAKTPANLTKAIVDYSPVGFVNTLIKGNNLRKAIETNQFTPQMQHEFAQSLGKATAGTMLYVLGAALASAGVISGESDEDKDTANFLKNTLGINSYSIKLGNKSFTFDWAQPIAAPLAITANLKGRDKEGQALLEGVIASMDTASSVLLEQSFLTGIREVLDDNNGIVSGMVNEVLKLPARAIPTFSKQIADLVDGTQRQTYVKGDPKQTAINAALVKIPGASKTLAPTVDTMGRDVQKYGGKNNLFNVFLNPANVANENISESAKEIYDVYKETGDKTIMPRVAPYSITTKDKSIELTPEQRTDFQRVSGKIIENAVQELTNNSEYNRLSSKDKAEVLNNITNYAYNKARQEVLNIPMAKTYNKVNEYTAKGGSVADYYLDKDEINYSLENDDKYQALSAFMDYDDYTNYAKNISKIKKIYTSENGYKKEQRKQKVVDYIEGLDLSIPQKVMLLKEAGGYGIGDYKNYMYNYINSLDLTKTQKEDIYYQLYPKRSE